RVVPRFLGTEQLFEVGSPRVHGGKKELVLAAESLIEDRFGDAGGFGDLAGGRGVPVLAEGVSGGFEHVIIGDCLLASHEALAYRGWRCSVEAVWLVAWCSDGPRASRCTPCFTS